MAAAVQEKDMTLLEMVEDEDLLDLSTTKETAARKNVADLVDQEHIKAQLQADEGNMCNNLMCALQSQLAQALQRSLHPKILQDGNQQNDAQKSSSRQAASMA